MTCGLSLLWLSVCILKNVLSNVVIGEFMTCDHGSMMEVSQSASRLGAEKIEKASASPRHTTTTIIATHFHGQMRDIAL